MNQTVLIIEDDRQIADWVKIYCERAGFSAQIAYDGETGLTNARTLNPDLIVLDLMLPCLNGMDVCHRLRRESDVPIIMLTAKSKLPDRIHGLEIGADDYIVKPFDPNELIARAKAVLRRFRGKVRTTLCYDRLHLDEATRQATLDSEPIKMTQAQFDLLAAFMRNPNQVLTREQLIELVFDNAFDGFDRAIDNHVLRLRKLIHRESFQPIQTVYRVGYRFVMNE